ncbi:MAG: nuclear transport factor 2 family protein [Proteobacteria bacterium]|nr:nuclear transport factor 2 family protein [Pseudomonadota bacterium]
MDRLDEYAAYLERLTPASLAGLDAYVTQDVRFKDPFNDLRGVDAMRRAFAMAFDHGPPRFEVIDRARGEAAGYLLWRYTHGSGLVVEGMTELRFAPDGRIAEHIDLWDSGVQFYSRIPVLGWLIGLVRNRFRIG